MMAFLSNRRTLQVTIALLALVPIGAGLTGIIGGPALIGSHDVPVDLDSHFRYLSGLLLGIGLMYWTTIPHIERAGGLFPALSALVVLGGLARLFSVLAVGWPNLPHILALPLELAVVPLLALWQNRLSAPKM